jgi:Fic family protein
MNKISLQIVQDDLLKEYKGKFKKAIQKKFEKLHDSELSIGTFSFYTSVSAVFSSRIEGEDIELDSFVKHKRFGVKYKPDYTRKIDDLYNAYLFAQKKKLTSKNIEQAHMMLTKHILQKSKQGKFRTGNMYVLTKDGRIEYVAASPEAVKKEMKKFYTDLKTLLETKLNFEETFFFAAMLHLVFIKIHPFEDGNGRTARLLEKWFLAQKLGVKAWFIQSERNYYDLHSSYYKNIRKLGLEYQELNYSAALPFINILPASVNYKGKA